MSGLRPEGKLGIVPEGKFGCVQTEETTCRQEPEEKAGACLAVDIASN